MEMLENIGMADRFLEYGIKNKGFTFNFQGQTHRTELDFTKSKTRYPYIVVFNQNETEKLLREHL
jgi:2-polyprenyl-6-methoxyphenol hydroxylase-like FAD-dependent oxidoreductase